MTVEILLWTWSGFFWGMLSVAALLIGLLLIVLILFQDSKDTGLTSAFGGGGSSALMGARMQKDLAKLTAIFAVALAICLILMGRITRFQTEESYGTVTSSGAPPASIPGGPGVGSGSPADLPSTAPPGLPLDPLAAPIIPAPGGDAAGFPDGLGSIPPGAISPPGGAAKSPSGTTSITPEAPSKAPEAAPHAPEAAPRAETKPAVTPPPDEKALPAVPAPAPAPEGSSTPGSTAPPKEDAGGTSPPTSR